MTSFREIERVLDARGVVPLAEKAVTINEEIGKGRFKRVYAGQFRQQCGADCRDVVVMQYKKESSEVKELSLLALLAGNACATEFVPEVFGVVDQRATVAVVQERATHGSLKAALQSPQLVAQFTPQHKLHAAMKLASALDYLQSMSIVHGDLSCRNVLLFHLDQDPSTVSVKITDFGLALIIADNSTSQIKKQPQATRWCSPETIAFNKYSFSSDMWSFGVSLWELFTDGDTPWMRFQKRAEVTAMLTDLSQNRETASVGTMSVDFPLPDDCPCDAYELIMSCLSVKEEARPTAAQASEMLLDLACANDSLEHSIATSDDADSIMSTEASVEFNPSASPVTMKLVRDLSHKLLQSTTAESISLCEHERPETSQLKALSDFLWSPYARSVLGDAAVQTMQQEVLEAEESLSGQAGSAPLRELLLPPVRQGCVQSWATAPPLSIWTLWSLAENNMMRRQDFMSEAAARAAFEKEDGARSRVLRGPDNEELYAPPLHVEVSEFI
mmetsp:Transcript_87933/g.155153  ORF Transcript_87933/g.155153 Transcript_87933/m.155153 type:complete len:502 (-) Transcript_87933:114-1619(-)